MKKFKVTAFVTGLLALGVTGAMITNEIKELPIRYADTDFTANWGTHELVQESNYELRDGATEGQYISYGPSYGTTNWYSRSSAMFYDLDKVSVLPSYKGYTSLLDKGEYSASTVIEQINYMNDTLHYDVIGGINGTSFNTSTGAPERGLMINGVEYSTVGNYEFGFFAIMENAEGDQKAVIGRADEYAGFKSGTTTTRTENGNPVSYAEYTMTQSIGGWGADLLIENGQLCRTDNWDDEHPRTAIGITAEGKVVTYVVEGRNSNRAGGMGLYNVASIMQELGCIYALNLDGGGSSTSISRRAGETEYANRIEGAYGADRAVSSAILFVNTASMEDGYEDTDTTFAKAQLTPNNDLYIVGTEIQFKATGSNAYGNPVAIPSDCTWEIDTSRSNTTGTIDPVTGLFKSDSRTSGALYVNLKRGDDVVGTTKVDLCWPSWAYTHALVTSFALDYNESRNLEFTFYPEASASNINLGISTWRPFVLNQCDLEWNLPDGCYVTIENNVVTFHSGPRQSDSKPQLDVPLSLKSIVGTGQTDNRLTNSISSVVTIGRSPDLIYDFEDADEDMSIWGISGKAKTLRKTSKEENKALFGNSALAIDYDMSDDTDPTTGLNSVAVYNDNKGYASGAVIPANAKYFGMWVNLPEGWDGSWLRVTFEGSNGVTNRSTLTRFETNTSGKTDKGIVGSGNWRFYYGELGVDISTNGSWTAVGPFSIYSMQFGWAPFADTKLGQSGADNIRAQFEKCKTGTIYIDNIMALYGDPTGADLVGPSLTNVEYDANDAAGTFDVTLTFTDIVSSDILAGFGYDEIKPLKDILNVSSGINAETVVPYIDGTAVPSSSYTYDDETNTLKITGLSISENFGKKLVINGSDYGENLFGANENTLLDASYTLTLIENGNVVSTESVKYGTTIALPEREYYTVKGDYDGTTMPTSDLVINLTYTPKDYLLTFVDVEGNEISKSEVPYTSTIVLPQKEGYTATGDYSETTMPHEALTIIVSYSINDYLLTFVDIDGNKIFEYELEYASSFMLPQKAGYTVSADYEGRTMPGRDLVVKVTYTPIKYTLTFVDENGAEISKQDVEYTSIITLPERVGYTVAGDYSGLTMPNSNLTIKVTYTINQYYLIIKDGDSIISANKINYGTNIVLPSKDGYTVTGDYTGTTMPARDLTINLTYTALPLEEVTITYVANGEVFATFTKVEIGAALPKPETNPTKEYYIFTGWDYEGTTAPSENITINAIFGIDTEVLNSKYDAIGSASTIEDRFAAIKAYEAELAHYTEADLEGTNYLTRLATAKTNYEALIANSSSDIETSNSISTWVVLGYVAQVSVLLFAVSFLIKRRAY